MLELFLGKQRVAIRILALHSCSERPLFQLRSQRIVTVIGPLEGIRIEHLLLFFSYACTVYLHFVLQ